jgi:hypothetical protein
VKGGRLVVPAGGSHGLIWTHWKEVNRALLDFLREDEKNDILFLSPVIRDTGSYISQVLNPARIVPIRQPVSDLNACPTQSISRQLLGDLPA